MKGPVIIRPLEVRDTEGVLRVLQSAREMHRLAEAPISEAKIRLTQYVERCSREDRTTALVAESTTGEILGVAVVDWRPTIIGGDEGFVSQLYVLDSARGEGIGTRLLESIVGAARARHSPRLILYISQHRKAYQRGFYQKAGWLERDDAALFELRLYRV